MRVSRLAAAAAACFLLTGCTYLFPPEEELLAPPLIEPAEIVYRTMEVTTGDIEQKLDVYARFSPSKTASVYFEGQGGRIADVAVKLGQQVKQGDLLIELNSDALKRQIRQQQIEVEKAELALENAGRVDIRASEFDMTRIKRVELNLQMEQDNYNNYENDWMLALKEVGKPEMEIEALKRKLDNQRLVIQRVKLELESINAEYEQWKINQDTTKEEEDALARVRQAELELRKQQNTLNDLNQDLKNSQLFAPFDGVVTYSYPGLEIGQNAAGYVTLFRISDPSQLILKYSGDSAATFAVGMDVTVTIKGKTYPGKVGADPSTIPMTDGKLVSEVHFVIDDMEENVSSGEDAKVTTILRRSENVVVLPKNTINTFWGRKYVNLMEDGVKVERDVEIGIETQTEVEVVKGLSAGELLILP